MKKTISIFFFSFVTLFAAYAVAAEKTDVTARPSARAQFDVRLDKAFENNKVLIVAFGWPEVCMKCDAFASDYADNVFPQHYKFIGVNIATSPEIKRAFSIAGVPHFKFFVQTSSKDLKLIGEFKGYEGAEWFLAKAAPIMEAQGLTQKQNVVVSVLSQ